MNEYVYDEVNKAQTILDKAEQLGLANAAETARLVESAVTLTIKVYHAEPGTRHISLVIYDRAKSILDTVWADGFLDFDACEQLARVRWLLNLCRPDEMPF